jgi:hypothetical protein
MMTGKANKNMGEVKNDNLVYQFTLNPSSFSTVLAVEQSISYVTYALDPFVDNSLGMKHRDSNK